MSIHFLEDRLSSILPIPLQSTSPLLVSVRVHLCGHGDDHRSGGGADLSIRVSTHHNEALVFVVIKFSVHVRVVAFRSFILVDGRNCTYDHPYMCPCRGWSRLDSGGLSGCSPSFSTTGAYRILKRRLPSPSTGPIDSL